MSLPLPEPLDIPDPNIDEPLLPSSEPLEDPDTPAGSPPVGDPPSEVAFEQA